MAHCQQVGEAEIDGKPWYHDIREYLKRGVYPLEAIENDKRTLRRLATGFLLSGIILYKSNANSTLLWCVDDYEAREIMEEVHGGAFGTHTNGHALARKILQVGYYWSKMESDYCQHVKRCMKCQIYVDNIHMAPFAVHNLTSPWLFSMDIICCYGLPARIITNNGTNLNNKMMTELCE
ncbi:Gypsy retrotransposon integrase-like protein 1, partial [Mucuna pruriens]